MKLIHSTSPENARSILQEGFRDTGEELDRGRWYRGSWFSDEPQPRIGSAFLAINLPDELVQVYELPDELNGYRRWLIPTSLLACYGPAQRVPEMDTQTSVAC